MQVKQVWNYKVGTYDDDDYYFPLISHIVHNFLF